jgi:hypothetical protein
MIALLEVAPASFHAGALIGTDSPNSVDSVFNVDHCCYDRIVAYCLFTSSSLYLDICEIALQ